MDGIIPYVLLGNQVRGLASGITNITYNTSTRQFDFTTQSGTHIYLTIPNGDDTVSVVSTLPTPSSALVDQYYLLRTDNVVYKCVYNTDDSKYEFVKITSDNKDDGIEIVDDYSQLTAKTENSIAYCIDEYTDTAISPNITYKSGFYFWNVTTGVWKLISTSNGECETYPDFIPNGHDYFIGDTFRDGDTKYEVIKDFTSGATVADNDDSVMEIVETYYYLTKEKKADLEARGLVKESSIYIISNADDVQDRYSEEFTTSSTDWNVQHNLGEQYPSKVCVFDDNGDEILLPNIEYYSMNLLIVHFDVPVSGKVIVIK